MKFPVIVTSLLAMLLAVAPLVAQENDSDAQVTDETRDCIPASELGQSTGEESGPEGEEAADAESELPVCDEEPATEAEAEIVPAPAPGDADNAQEDGPGDDVDDEDFGREFEPTDEISEDYPIPLPSDI